MVALRLLSRQWIVDEEGKIIIGEGRREIFENIEKTGSINQTAKVMKMSYKGVWSKIKATEKHLNQNIVYADRKEGSRLTRQGKELMEKYKKLEKKCIVCDDRILSKIFKSMPKEDITKKIIIQKTITFLKERVSELVMLQGAHWDIG